MKITQHSFGCQTIEEEFTGKNLTLFGGLGLVSKFFGGLRLCKTLRILDKQWERVRFVVIRTEVKEGEKPKKELGLFKYVTSSIKYNYQVIATNSKESAKEVWEFYNKRANCENMIKEGIYSYGLDKTVSQSFWAMRSGFR